MVMKFDQVKSPCEMDKYYFFKNLVKIVLYDTIYSVVISGPGE